MCIIIGLIAEFVLLKILFIDMKRKSHPCKNNDIVVIPLLLSEKIKEIGFRQQSQVNRAYLIFKVFLKSYFKRDISLDSYAPFPSSYLKKAVGHHYGRTLKELISHGLIYINDSYSNFENCKCCKSYKIDPSLLLSGNLVPIPFSIPSLGIPGRIRQSAAKNPKVFLKNTTLRLLNDCVKIDKDHAAVILDSYIDSGDYLEYVRLNDLSSEKVGIEVSYCASNPSSSPFRRSSTVKAQLFADKKGLDLIRSKRKYYVGNFKDFKKLKSLQIQIAYISSVVDLTDRHIRFRRGIEEGRVYTNFTSIPSRLLPCVSINNERLSTIDLKNSHFVILASQFEKGYFREYLDTDHCLNHNDSNQSSTLQTEVDQLSYQILPADILKFISLARNGKFYEEIQKLFSLDTRNEAKSIIFELLYSSYKFNSDDKKKLKKNFPNLVNVIDTYKKKNGDNMFSVNLQKIESELFIDKILIPLLRKGFHVFTKHDSILFPRSEKSEIMEIVREILDNELKVYQLTDEDL